jgi:hypothetical protein
VDSWDRAGWIAIATALACPVGLAGGIAALPRAFALGLLEQGGAMEVAELAAYGVAMALLVAAPLPERGITGWCLAALGMLGFFEINPGRWIEGWVEVTPAHPGDPAGLRLTGLAALGALVAAVFGGLFLLTRRRFRSALGAGRPEAWMIAIGVICLGAAFALDRYHASHWVWNRGYRLTSGIAFASHVLEEILELVAPVLFALAAGHRGLRRRAGGAW